MKHYDYETRLASIRAQPHATDWVASVLAFGILVICIAVGLLGLLLPVLPGLLFLAFAALIAAKLFPPFEHSLRKSPWFAPYLNHAENFTRLRARGKIRFVCWMTLKVVVDGFRMLFAGVTRLVSYLGACRT
jgi:uncharacterized membrane protein YbaN (DUF454 family)